MINLIENIIYKANFCRNFELSVQQAVKDKLITCPIYLSIGQELLPAVLSEFYPTAKLFAQHRAHSYFLSFGGDPKNLILQLLGKEGSASIHIPNKMIGHSGLMGDQVPIAVGAALNGINPIITVMGDASAEEDYVLGAIGFASKKELPILFIIEDNNLSILTEKIVRRNWEMSDIGKAFKLKYSIDIEDNLIELINTFSKIKTDFPSLVNVRMNRLCWHAGTGMNDNILDRLSTESKNYIEIANKAKLDNLKLWDSILHK